MGHGNPHLDLRVADRQVPRLQGGRSQGSCGNIDSMARTYVYIYILINIYIYMVVCTYMYNLNTYVIHSMCIYIYGVLNIFRYI